MNIPGRAFAAAHADDGVILLFAFLTETDPACPCFRRGSLGIGLRTGFVGSVLLLLLNNFKSTRYHPASSDSLSRCKVATETSLAPVGQVLRVLYHLMHGRTGPSGPDYSIGIV